jgi:hypothetical protein
MLTAILILLAANFYILIRIYLLNRSKKLREGDLVIVQYPRGGKKAMNMVTLVLGLPDSNTVHIRAEGVTTILNRKWVTKIPVNKNYPIRVPGKPDLGDPPRENRTKFEEIPLRWFEYYPDSD